MAGSNEQHGGHGEHEGHSATGGHGEHDGHSATGGHDGSGRHAGHSVADFRRRFWISLALTAPVILLSPGLPFMPERRVIDIPGADWVLLGLSTVLYVFGGKPFLLGMVRELRERRPGMMTLVAVAISVAYLYSAATVLGLEGMPFFWELATLIDVMLLGHWVEMRSVGEASKALESLARLMPSTAHRRTADGSTEDVPIADLRVGDVVVLRPGEKMPADGTVTGGHSWVDESLLTGESVPVTKSAGDSVIGGSVNGEGSLEVRVERTGSESFLSQVIELVRQAQESKSKTQDLADRAATVLTLVALGGGAATLATWLALDEPLAFAMERAVTVMVIACPHALGLAIPLVVAVSTSLGAGAGLLVRDRMAFENARLVDAVVFDKTGTLTQGRFGVADVRSFGARSPDEVLGLAGAVEALSEHPIARAIASEAQERGQRVAKEATDFRAIPGRGAQANVGGRAVAVVSPGYLEELGLAEPEAAGGPAAAFPGVSPASTAGRTVVYVVVDGAVDGRIAVADTVRPEAAEAIRRLIDMGIEPIMLTGDSRTVAEVVAAELGISRVFAEVLPADKAAKVRGVKAEGRRVAMVGDGVNDAPALAEADVGIAIGAGTDVAVATADVVLVHSDPQDVAAIISLARATYSKMRQNLAWATGYNVIAIPLAAGVLAGMGVLLSPAVGGMLMAGSTVIVAINARLLRV